jgi:hypothetical protein
MAIMDQSVHFFFHTLQTQYFNVFFIVILLFIQPPSLVGLFLSITIYLIYHKDWRTLIYWINLSLTTAIIVYGLSYSIHLSQLEISIKNGSSMYFPAIEITFATAMFGFLIFYISTRYRTTITLTIRIILLSLLFLAGIGTIYLGENLISSVLGAYFIGLTICLAHWIFYRKITENTSRSQLPIIFSCLVLVVMTIISYWIYYHDKNRLHQPSLQQYVLTDTAWWNQKETILPVYTNNRIGRKNGVFNLQYSGDIDVFEQALISSGWNKQSVSFLNSLMDKFRGVDMTNEMPLVLQMYQNRKPLLIMIAKRNNHHPALILRLWRSNYYLDNTKEPIWIGSVHPNLSKKNKYNLENYVPNNEILFNSILSSTDKFDFNKIYLKDNMTEKLTNSVTPVLLIIKEKHNISDIKNV